MHLLLFIGLTCFEIVYFLCKDEVYIYMYIANKELLKRINSFTNKLETINYFK